MFTDMVGFSRVTQINPLLARELNEQHQKIIRSYLSKYEGIEKQTTGDGFFAEFKSAIEAMNCAVEIQQAIHDRNLTRSSENQIFIRIGLHLGDIFEKEGEIFGDSVNIAARLEPLAESSGICLSKSFFELVKSNWAENRFSSKGFFELKNIKGSIELFKFNFPWHSKPKKTLQSAVQLLKSTFNREQWTLFSLFAVGLCFLVFILAKVLVPQFQSASLGERRPSSIKAGSGEVRLDSGWTYSRMGLEWKEYNPKESWRYVETMQGEFTLKNEFVITEKPIEPALTIGLIPDSHRVYLNGQYIGGSNHLSDLGLYSFDAALLKLYPDKNKLVVQVEARANLNPGFMLLSDVPPQLAEFNKLDFLHSKYFLKFYILKNIYFVFSFIVFLLSLTYALYLKNKNDIFYSTLFLLLGCLHYAYYNPWVISTFDYPFLRFLRLSCIVISSLVLYSGYLATRGRSVLCTWNNLIAMAFGMTIFGFFTFFKFESPESFVSFYNVALLISLIYMAIVAVSSIFTELVQRKELSKKSSAVEPVFFLSFTLLSVFNILGAFKNSSSDAFFSAEIRARFNDFGIAIAFMFAIGRISLAVLEFTRDKRQSLLNKKKDDFFIELTRVVSDSRPVSTKIDLIQEYTNQFLTSEKSTIYLLNAEDNQLLKLFAHKGYAAEIEDSKSVVDGIFGYAIQNKRPLLIEDINQDYRFTQKLESSQFKSGSCLILPLMIEEKVLGILTFADKENNHKFLAVDLEIGLRVSSFLSLLIAGSQDIKKVS